MNETLKVLETRRSCRNFNPDLNIEGDYEGIGNCAIGYAKTPVNPPAPRKADYVYYVR